MPECQELLPVHTPRGENSQSSGTPVGLLTELFQGDVAADVAESRLRRLERQMLGLPSLLMEWAD